MQFVFQPLAWGFLLVLLPLLIHLINLVRHRRTQWAAMEFLLESGVKGIGLLAISDQGVPSHNEKLAEQLAKLGMPCFGCTPERLPELLAGVLRGSDLKALAGKVASTAAARRIDGARGWKT